MQITLRCTHATPHPDGTQTVSLTADRELISPPEPPQPRGRGKANSNAVKGPALPVPAPGTPTSILVTNWRNGVAFAVNALYSVDIEAV